MRRFVAKIVSLCCVVLLCAGCKVTEGTDGERLTTGGWLLFNPVNNHLEIGQAMVWSTLLVNEYSKLETDEERRVFKLDYFRGREIARGDHQWYVINDRGIEWRITMDKNLALDESGATWTVDAGPGYYYSWRDEVRGVFSPADVEDEYHCTLHAKIEGQLDDSSLDIRGARTQSALSSFSIAGAGELSVGSFSPTIVRFMIQSPLLFDFSKRYPVEGELRIEIAAFNTDVIEQTEVHYAPYDRVKIIYNQIEEWWYLPYAYFVGE